MSKLSLAACALSVLVHLITLLGFHPKAIMNFQFGLFFGIFLMFLPTYLAQERLLSEVPQRDRFHMFSLRYSSAARTKIILGNAPAWLQKMFKMLGYYFFAFFAVFAYRTFPNKATELEFIQMMSTGVAVFYCGFATTLASYARTDHPLRLDEI